MKGKAMVVVAVLFSVASGYSMHGVVPESSPPRVISPTPVLERFCWHLDRAESTYAVIFKSQRPAGEGLDLVFRRSLEEAKECKRELLEDPNRKYSDFRIAFVTTVPAANQ
jgi:hypothetical protein